MQVWFHHSTLVPCAAVALDQRDCLAWTPRSCGVALDCLAGGFPALQDWIYPLPGRLDLVATHEQRLVRADRIHQQAFVGIRIADGEGFGKAHVERDAAKAHAAGTRVLDHQRLLDAFVWLQPNDQLVGGDAPRCLVEDVVGDRLEGDDDLRHSCRQPLARADVEGHSGPPPISDLSLDGNEGLGVGDAAFQLVQVTFYRPSSRCSRSVLAPHSHVLDIALGDGLKCPQDLELLVSHRLGAQRRGDFHGDKAEQLKDVVLHHVAQCAGRVVIAGAAFQSDGLRNGDLHVVDVLRVPERLVEGIGEAQRHQVLHRLLAEVVIDAEDLLFLEYPADGVIELQCRREVAADRLLHDDPGLLGDQLVVADLFRDGAEDRRSNGKIEDADAILAAVQKLLELVPALIRFRVNRDVEQPLAEALDLGVIVFSGFEMLAERVTRKGPILFVGKRAAGRTDDAGGLEELSLDLSMIERRQQLSFRKVARSAKHDAIKGIDRDNLAAHKARLSSFQTRTFLI
ncbi:protein of unknown function [Pseudorhizobium banfieldiae]|uniref:Uncharacterized protein n=1 Tax=Pseudorhizobium banfieldiae TaxID=1125847 RepID=L0NAE3_9HYPH|nr:protein of unknown function [Pseudorhizobium banfieldiae]